MEIVKLKSDSGLVEITVTVAGPKHWYFTYAARGREFYSRWDQPEPYNHPIGYGSDIKNRFHPWEFSLVNVTDSEQEYRLTITWRQDSGTLHEWSTSGTIPAKDGDIVGKRAWVYLEEEY